MVDYLKSGDDDEIVRRIRELIGVGPNEPVEVLCSQCERNGRTVYYTPRTEAEFDKLKTAPESLLIDMCLVKCEDGHYLYPGEWFDYIPEGYEVVDIHGEKIPFSKKLSDDIRFGCLAYGFKK